MGTQVTGSEERMLARDTSAHPWHVTEVTLLGGAGLSRMEVEARLAGRIHTAVRLRQLSRAGAWADDASHALGRHVGQVRIPAGSSLGDLWAVVRDAVAGPQQPAYPRWDLAAVASLEGSRCALITRIHPAWADSHNHPHPLQVLCDDTAGVAAQPAQPWDPTAVDATSEPAGRSATEPGHLLSTARSRLGRVARQSLSDLRRGLESVEPVPEAVHAHVTTLPLRQVAAVAQHRGVTVHDVVIALVTGALVRSEQTGLVRALVPQAVEDLGSLGVLGVSVAATTLALPTTAADALDRLDAVASLTAAAREGRPVASAARLMNLPGMACATMHVVAARLAVEHAHDLLISNVPGPRQTRWLGDRPVCATYPLLGLTGAERLSVGVTSLSGQLCVGLCATTPPQALAGAMIDELHELAHRTEA